ncbi:MAG: hypothetical protein ABSH22_10050 [Tepidisphaeraceae bacterium]|jgi:hypothetical protein
MASDRRRKIWAVVLCGTLCAAFAATAWKAVGGKSATADEPGHAAVGWLMLWRHDYRLWQNNPPLWEYWIALPVGPDAIRFDPASELYRNIQPGPVRPFWTRIDTPRLIQGGRFMCLVLAVGLGLIIAVWAWELGGLVPAVAATFLYCLDPNFLGHAALIKNDVAFALFYCATAYALWRAGRNLTGPAALLIALLTAIGFEVKYSGPLLAVMVILTLGARALSAQPWMILGRPAGHRGRKLAAAAVTCLLAAVMSYLFMWMSYGFRFDGGPDGLRLSMRPIMQSLGVYALNHQLGRNPSRDELAEWTPPLATRAVLFAEEHHLVPQAWAAGLIFTQMGDQGEQEAYLLGDHYHGGKWYYFPMAAIFKEPLATISAALLSLAIAARAAPRALRSWENRWNAIALSIPAGVYALALITSEMNIGFRHAFPLLPFVFIAVGLAVGTLWEFQSGRMMSLILATALLVETAAAFPDFIAFFNAACSGDRLRLLSDSNLDWGQDLPLLAAWQSAHADIPLYLDYFGPSAPGDYHIRCVDVSGTLPPAPRGPGVLAVSATFLQLHRYNGAALEALGVSPDQQPDQILGGTIYLFQTRTTAH